MQYWIARDKDGNLFLYENQPQIPYEEATYFNTENFEKCFELPSDAFPELTFENSPKRIKLSLLD